MGSMLDNMSVVKHGFRRGVRIVVRGKEWRSAVLPILSVFLLLYILVFSFYILQAEKKRVLQRYYVRLEVLDGASDQKVQEFHAALQKLPFLNSVLYATRENIFERERQHHPDLIAFLEEFKIENPFTDTFSVRLRSLQYHTSLRRFLEEERWHLVIDMRSFSQALEDREEIHAFLNVLSSIETFLMVSVAIAVLTIFSLIIPVTRSLARDDPSFLRMSLEQRTLQTGFVFLSGMIGSLFIGGFVFLVFWTLFPSLRPGVF